MAAFSSVASIQSSLRRWQLPARARALRAAVADAWSTLQQAAARPDFEMLLADVFNAGSAGFSARANSLIRQLASGEALPLDVRFVGNKVLPTATAAYVHASGRLPEEVLVNRSWFRDASPQEREGVLLEEIGHALDQCLNDGQDSPGDEGELFSALIRGLRLSAAEVAGIRADDDSGHLQISAGQTDVEFAAKPNSQAAVGASPRVVPASSTTNLTVRFANAYSGTIPDKGNPNQPASITLERKFEPGKQGIYFSQSDDDNDGVFDADNGNNIAGTLHINGVPCRGTISRLFRDS